MEFQYSYEEAVKTLRNKPEYAEFITQCYLDADIFGAAARFAGSEEFITVTQLLKLQNNKAALKILDLGCGNGITSYAFAKLGHKVFAVDPNSSQEVGIGAISKLNAKLPGNLIVSLLAFGEALPFPDATFDIVYTRQVLHHFLDLQKGLKECYRVLKPGGYLLATRDHVINNRLQLDQFLQGHILHQMHGGENAYTLNTYISNFKQAGFRVKKRLSTYDTVINHYPLSNNELKKLIEQAVRKKIKFFPAFLFLRLPLSDLVYRKLLTFAKKYPGRLYSFLCVRPK